MGGRWRQPQGGISTGLHGIAWCKHGSSPSLLFLLLPSMATWRQFYRNDYFPCGLLFL
jgi:hypothetical protein